MCQLFAIVYQLKHQKDTSQKVYLAVDKKYL